MQNAIMSPEVEAATLLSLEHDLQQEWRDKPEYRHWAGETFMKEWPGLWSQIQIQIRNIGATGNYAHDGRDDLLRRRLVAMNGELLPARATAHMSINVTSW